MATNISVFFLLLFVGWIHAGTVSEKDKYVFKPASMMNVDAQVWEDATNATIRAARACFKDTPVYLSLYYPKIEMAFNGKLVAHNLIQCEGLLLGSVYQRLSGALSPCEAMAHGIRSCAHYISTYGNTSAFGNPYILPVHFPVPTFTSVVEECNAAVALLPRVPAKAANTLFRHRMSPGTNCLRENTRQALVQETLFPGLV